MDKSDIFSGGNFQQKNWNVSLLNELLKVNYKTGIKNSLHGC